MGEDVRLCHERRHIDIDAYWRLHLYKGTPIKTCTSKEYLINDFRWIVLTLTSQTMDNTFFSSCIIQEVFRRFWLAHYTQCLYV